MDGCTKAECPLIYQSERAATECPYYTDIYLDVYLSVLQETTKICNECHKQQLIYQPTRYIVHDPLQEIKNQIVKMQTYKLFLGDGEKYINRDEVLQIIDEKIKEYSE